MIQGEKKGIVTKPSHSPSLKSSITRRTTNFATKTQTRRIFRLRRCKASNESSGDGACGGFHRIKSEAGFHTGGYIGTWRVNRRSTATGAGVPPITAGARISPLTAGAGIPPFTAVPWI